ncbi:MAG: hypothetical protein JW951_03310 [Lentisphaerae bacterium]|nr:hypothetical protein [Lentisphaerota bacterium]
MRLTRKERVRRVLAHEPVDRLPTHINYTRTMGETMAAHFGVSVEALPEHLDNHLFRVEPDFERSRSADGKTVYDGWHVGWSTESEGYLPTDSPLAGDAALADFAWPDPDAPGLFDRARQDIARVGDAGFIVPNFGFCLFERAWSLRGLERFLMDLVEQPMFVEELLDRIVDIQVQLARRFVALGVDGGYFGDDYGAQKGLLFAPQTWRGLIKPRLARMFGVFRDAGLPVLMHSDGDIAEIVPDLVEIGLSALNPVQPEVLDHAWLTRTFGGRLAFYGGISTQTVLPHGTPEAVREAAEACIRDLAVRETGYIPAPSHRLQQDTPMENLEALLEVFTRAA